MSFFKALLAAGSFASIISAQSLLLPRASIAASGSSNSQAQAQQNATNPTSVTSTVTANDVYKVYAGPADPAVWPTMAQWISDYDTMFANNLPIIKIGCQQFGVPNNSPTEISELKDAIRQVSGENGVDARYILAIILQESTACVRTPSTFGVHNNPGLMQSNQGTGTCNQNGVMQNPCPQAQIIQMVRDGATGTASGPGFSRILPTCPLQNDMKYYQAARIYNSGSIDSTGYLERGVATHCYASDVANRLTGWVQAASKCTFDSQGLPPLSAPTSSHMILAPARSTGVAAVSSRRLLLPVSMAASPSGSVVPSSRPIFGGVVSQAAVVQPQPSSTLAVSVRPSSASTVTKAVAGNPAPGVTTNCAKYYRVKSGDNCGLVTASNSITVAQFLSLNAGVNSQCTNLWLGYDYCVQGL